MWIIVTEIAFSKSEYITQKCKAQIQALAVSQSWVGFLSHSTSQPSLLSWQLVHLLRQFARAVQKVLSLAPILAYETNSLRKLLGLCVHYCVTALGPYQKYYPSLVSLNMAWIPAKALQVEGRLRAPFLHFDDFWAFRKKIFFFFCAFRGFVKKTTPFQFGP